MSNQNPPRVTGVSEQKPRSRAGGRPEYKPTDEQRSQVRELVGKDTPRSEIAKAIGVSPTTLRKHFAAELGEKVDQAGQLDLTEPHKPASTPSPEPGRPEFEPTWRMREDVKLCKADNWSDDRIARLLGVSRNTLLKYFAPELDQGADLVRIQVLRDLKMASGKGSRPAAEAILNLPGMVAPLEQLPTPEPDEAPAPDSERVGKKQQADRDAQAAHQGTTWSSLVD